MSGFDGFDGFDFSNYDEYRGNGNVNAFADYRATEKITESKNPILNEYRKFNYSIDNICELIDSGVVDVNYIDDDADDHNRHTILHEACLNNDERMVELLLSKGADPNKYYEKQASRQNNYCFFNRIVSFWHYIFVMLNSIIVLLIGE
jgi:hypothetical protein